MKIVAIIVLSLFLTKSCNEKKNIVDNETKTVTTEETVKVEAPKKTPQLAETVNTETQKQENAAVVEYEALSRGFYQKIVFENNQLTIVSSRDGKANPVKLSKEDISEISTLIKAVNLDGLGSLKAPTDKRLYDGAAHANLIITTKGKTYSGAGFDHGAPPTAIAKLVNKLVSFTGEK